MTITLIAFVLGLLASVLGTAALVLDRRTRRRLAELSDHARALEALERQR